MTREDINHLYRRAGLYVPPPEAYEFIGANAASLVQYLMTYRDDATASARAEDILDGYFNDGLHGAVTRSGLFGYAWWTLRRTVNQFHERLAWFAVHDRLSASVDALQKVGESNFRYTVVNYIQKIREIAGRDMDYRRTVLEIGEDPLMIAWLDLHVNRPGAPNQNYARELMELFTLDTQDLDGNPNYTQQDIAEVARAFTGWSLQASTSGPNVHVRYFLSVFNPTLFDQSPKTIFAGTPWQGTVQTGRDVVNHIFDHHPNASVSLARWIHRHYIGGSENRTVILELAALIRQNDFQLRPVFERLLNSAYFYAPERHYTILKHPVGRKVHAWRAVELLGNGGIWGNHIHPGLSIACAPLDPDTVFGCDRAIEIPQGQRLMMDMDSVNSTLRDGALSNDYSLIYPNPNPSFDQILDHLLSVLGIEITPDQRALIAYYSNNRLVDGQIVPDPWVSEPSWVSIRKVDTLWTLLMALPQFFNAE